MKNLIDPEGRFAKLIEPTITGMGYDLVRVRQMSAAKGDTTLQIMVEYPDGRVINVEDCTKISRAISALFDVEDPFTDAYNLEVSSAGLPRPLTRVKDFQNYTGFEMKCELAMMVNGRKRFKGILAEAGEDTFVIRDEEQKEFELAYAQLANAALVYSDTLLAYEQKRKALPENEDLGDDLDADDTEDEIDTLTVTGG